LSFVIVNVIEVVTQYSYHDIYQNKSAFRCKSWEERGLRIDLNMFISRIILRIAVERSFSSGNGRYSQTWKVDRDKVK